MPKNKSNNTISSGRFEHFLDSLLDEERYPLFAEALRSPPAERYYANDTWCCAKAILDPYPEAQELLRCFALQNLDAAFGGFTDSNLKACYIIDEDFINDGRAFVLFTLVASNWTYVGTMSRQQQFWKKSE